MMGGLSKRLVLFAFFSVVIALLSAQDAFSQANVTLTPINDEIIAMEFAEFELEIKNLEPETHTFSLDFGIAPLWSIISTPAYRIQVKSGETGSFRIFAKARSLIPDQLYSIPFTISYGDKKINRALMIKYGDVVKEPKEYKPTVVIKPEAIELREIDPRETIAFKIHLSNLNVLNMSELSAILFSEGRLIDAHKDFSLAPLERKVILIETSIDPHTKPQRDKVTIALKYQEKIIATFENIEIEVKGYEDIKTEEKTASAFLREKKDITIENNGNYDVRKTYKKEIGFFKRIFTKTEPGHYIIREEGKSFLTWDYSLSPKETFIVSISTSYVSIFVVLVIAGLVVLFYFLLRSPLQCRKNVDVSKKGDTTLIKVKLSIKNRSSSDISNITVKEIIHPLMLVSRESQIGVIEPRKIIKHKTKGTLLEWHIDRLEPFEERLIIYKAATKISIIGEIILKSALARFQYKGKEKSTKSNSYILEV